MIHAFVDATFDRDPTQLQQHRTGGSVDEIATEWQLDNGSITFGNVHETW